MSAPVEPEPYPTRDPWEGTDEDDGDYCHHGVPFDEPCDDCDEETAEEEA